MILILRSVWLYINGFVSVITIGTIVLCVGIFDKKKNITGVFVRLWGHWICKSSGINISIEGLEFLSQKQQYIFIANHESLIDIPLSFIGFKFNFIKSSSER